MAMPATRSLRLHHRGLGYDRAVRLHKDAKVELISRVPLFARCSKKELRMIANLADQIEWPEGKTLIKEGRVGSEFFVLIDGTVSVSRDGRKLGDLAAGEWVGEVALIARVPRTATVVTTSPIRALVLTGGGFSQLIGDYPSIAAKVLAVLGERVAPEAI